MTVNPHLNFNGQCEAAFKFYEQHLGGKIVTMMTFASSPMGKDMPPEWQQRIIHVSMDVGGTTLMGSDAPPGRYQPPQGITVCLAVATVEEAEQAFAALSENANYIMMPIQQTFWSPRFGMLVDQFGIPWMVNCQSAG